MNSTIIRISSADGSVWTAGLNTYNQLSGRIRRRPTFAKVLGLPAVKRLAVGAYHCAVLTEDDRVTILDLTERTDVLLRYTVKSRSRGTRV